MESTSNANPSPPHHHSCIRQSHSYGQLDDSQSTTPLYWQHRRRESYASIGVTPCPPITLEDHTEEAVASKSPLWAKMVSLDGYILVSGNLPSVRDYVVWLCRIETLEVGVLSSLPLQSSGQIPSLP